MLRKKAQHFADTTVYSQLHLTVEFSCVVGV